MKFTHETHSLQKSKYQQPSSYDSELFYKRELLFQRPTLLTTASVVTTSEELPRVTSASVMEKGAGPIMLYLFVFCRG